MLSGRIEKRAAFAILAVSREFEAKTAMAEIPRFWEEYYGAGYGGIACGQYGVCFGSDGEGRFRYAIGNECRVEKRADGTRSYHIFNCPDREEIPAGFELLEIPSETWASFDCVGALPHSIQDTWPRIYEEWLPQSGYEKIRGFDIEEYGKCEQPSDAQKPDYRCVIRIPVRKCAVALDDSAFELRTERLKIRRFRAADGEALFEYLSDPEVVKFEPYEPFTRAQAFAEAERRASDRDFFAVERLEDERLLGNLYFSARDFGAMELGYVFSRSAWHCGYASEAARALMRFAFENTECRRIIAACDPANSGSWRLLERLGMRRERHGVQDHYFKKNKDGSPRWADSYAYAILRREFFGAADKTVYSVRENVLTAADFVRLFRAPGWEAPPQEQAEAALKNSLVVFSVYAGEILIGMGRLIGDRAMAYMVRDVVILPEFQGRGAGAFLLRAMLDWIAHDLPCGWKGSCELFAARGKGGFYEKFGFEPLPNAVLENGMMRMVEGVK